MNTIFAFASHVEAMLEQRFKFDVVTSASLQRCTLVVQVATLQQLCHRVVSQKEEKQESMIWDSFVSF